MKKVVEERKDIVFFIKMYPLKQIQPEAYDKAKAILCEKSLALLDDAFQRKPLPKPSCDTKAVDESIQLAQRLGIQSVPTLIMPDGRVIPGARDAKPLIELITR